MGDNDFSRFDDELFTRMRKLGDPLADDVVAPLLDRGETEKIRSLMASLVTNDQIVPDGLPVDVTDYLDATASLPGDVDMDRVARGQAVFEEFGPEIAMALFCASLPSAYASTKGVHALAQTARLATDTRRRILETGQFLVNVMAPGGLGPHGKGIRSIQHVRLMHAAVRHLILAHQADAAVGDEPPPWDDRWGHPINQEDLAGTLMSFAWTVGDPLPRMGVQLRPRECEDYIYVWRVIGHQLGLVPEVIPHDVDEARALVDLIRTRNFGRSDDGVLMTGALIDLLAELTPGTMFDDVPADMIRMLIGNPTADLLKVPSPSRHFGLLALLRVLLHFTTHEIENHKVLRDLSRHIGFRFIDAMLTYEDRGEGRTAFDIPDQLVNGWRLRHDPTKRPRPWSLT